MRNPISSLPIKLAGLLALALLLPSHAYAACTSPAGASGSLNWDGTKFQYCNNSNVWTDFGGGGGTPGGSTTQVQYNNAGAFGADSGFTYAGSGAATITGAAATALSVTTTNTTANSAAIKGISTGTSNTLYGVYGSTASTSGAGVYGVSTGSTGYGGYFIGDVYGVRAVATGVSGAFGVYATSSGSGSGLFGSNSSTGTGTSGYNSSTGSGVYGYNDSTSGGKGVRGRITAASGGGIAGYFSSMSSGGIDLMAESEHAGSKGLVVKGAASQTANLAEFQDSAGTALSLVDASGKVAIGTSSAPTVRLNVGSNYSAYDAREVAQFGSSDVGDNYITVRSKVGTLTQTYSGIKVGASAANPNIAFIDTYSGISSGGAPASQLSFRITGSEIMNLSGIGLGIGVSSGLSSALAVSPLSASGKGILVRGYASQTGNLAEFQNSGATVLSFVDAAGNLAIGTGSGYLNFGTTAGTSGFGFRDNGGTLQFKKSTADTWNDLTAGGGGGTPGGSTTQVQFNNAGAFGGDSGFTYAGSGALTITGAAATNALSVTTTSTTSGATAVYGQATGTTGLTYGAQFTAAGNGSGTSAVYGVAVHTTGTNYGGRFGSVSSSGTGVYGYASSTSGTTYGVYADASANTGGVGTGVYGKGGSYGVYGIGEIGVYGTSSTTGAPAGQFASSGGGGSGIEATGTGYGAKGLTAGSTGIAVYGNASSTTGVNYGGSFISSSSSGISLLATAGNAATKGLVVKGAASQTGNLAEFQNSSGTALTTISATGGITASNANGNGVIGVSTYANGGTGITGSNNAVTGVNYGGYFTSNSTTGISLYALAGNAATVGLLVKGQSSQTGDLAQFQNSSSTVLTKIDSAGSLTISNAAATALSSTTSSTSGTGVYGSASSSTGTNYGGMFYTSSASGYGVYAYATSSTGTNYGGSFGSNSASGVGLYAYGSNAATRPLVVQGATSQTADLAQFLNVGSNVVTRIDKDGNIGIGTTIGTAYINFGSTMGSTGYGIRDNAGTVECRNSSGSWAACAGGGGGSPGGSTTQIQYNNSGAFGADSGFTYAGSGAVTITGAAATSLSVTTSSGTGKAVVGTGSATAGANYGGYFTTASSSGTAVYGRASSTSSMFATYGGYFQTDSATGTALYATDTSSGYAIFGTSTTGTAVYGSTGGGLAGSFLNSSSTGTGILGQATSTTGANYGGRFISNSSGGISLMATAGNAATKGLVVKAAASQTGNLAEFQDSSGTALTVVSSAGRVGIGTNAPGYPLDVRNTNTGTSGNQLLQFSSMPISPGSASTATYYADYNALYHTTNNVTGITGTYNGLETDASATIGTMMGVHNYVLSSSGTVGVAKGTYNRVTAGFTGGAITTATGSDNTIEAFTGITSAAAVRANLYTAASKTIGDARGISIENTNSGTMTNWYGVYIAAISGGTVTTTRAPIYSLDTGTSYLAGGVRFAASQYINFGATAGSSGYGIRDNAGTIQVKKSTADSWTDLTVGGGTPAGSTTQMQYNNAGAFGADSGFTYAGSGAVTIAGSPTQTLTINQSNNTSGKGIFVTGGVIPGYFTTSADGSYGVYSAIGSSAGGATIAGYFINNASGGTAINATTGHAAVKGLVVKGFTSQSANLAEFQNVGGTAMTTVDAAGSLAISNAAATALSSTTSSTTGKAVSGVASATSGTTYGGYFTSATTDTGTAVYGAATGTSALVTRQYGGYFTAAADAATAVYGAATYTNTATNYGGYFTSASRGGSGVRGYATNAIGSGIGGFFESDGATGTSLYVLAGNAGTKGLVVQAAASQTADLAQFQNSSGTPLASISAAGSLTISNTTAAPLSSTSSSTSGQGVLGTVSATSGTTYGVYGDASANTGGAGYGVYGAGGSYGVYGLGLSYGVTGYATNSTGAGVYGYGGSSSGANYGGYFESASTSGTSVFANAGTASTIGLVVMGRSGQTADLTQYMNNMGSVISKVDASGSIGIGTGDGYLNFGGTMGTSGFGLRDNSGTLQYKTSTAGSWSNFSAGGSPGGSTTQVQFNNAGAFGADSGFTYAGSGAVTINGGAVTGLSVTTNNAAGTAVYGWATSTYGQGGWFKSSGSSGISLAATAGSAGAKGLVVQGAASQTADLAQFMTSTGTVLTLINAAGQIYTSTATTADTEWAIRGSITGATGATYAGSFTSASATTNAVGVYGFMSATSGGTFAGWFQNASSAGRGVYGLATSATGTTYGGYFKSQSASGISLMAEAGHASAKGLIVKGYTSQSANLQEWQDSSGTVLAFVGSKGEMQALVSNNGSAAMYGTNSNTGAGSVGVWGNASGATGTTYGGFFTVTSSSGTGVYGSASSSTGTTYGGYFTNNSASGTALYAIATNAGAKGLVVKAAASQTADLAQFQNSSGTPLASIAADGSVNVAGSASAAIQGNSSRTVDGTIGVFGWVDGATGITYGGQFQSYSASGIALAAIAGNAATKGLVVKGAASQTGDLAQFQNSSATVLAKIDSAGNVSTPSVILTSDKRYKQKIEPLKAGALEIIAKLEPVTYEWKDTKETGVEAEHVGFIAQDVQKILPQVVSTDKSSPDQKLGIRYNELIPVLVKAVQEQQTQIDALKAEIKTLKEPKAAK
jgi:hypothetical protein